MGRSRHRLRRIAAALALLWIALPVASVVHGVVEAHTYCAEHQTLEHAGPAHGHGNLTNAVYGGDEDAHPHGDACAFSRAHVRDEAVLRAASVTDVTPHQGGVVVSLCAQTCAPQLSILSTAPKSSPPA